MNLSSTLKNAIRKTRLYKKLDSLLCNRYTDHPEPERWNRGQFYSPLPSFSDIASHDFTSIPSVESIKDIDFRLNEQLLLLQELFCIGTPFPWTTKDSSNHAYRFSLSQDYFTLTDARVLFNLLLHLKPSKVVEIGSGHSSALMLDVNQFYLESRIDFTFIDPYPERLLSCLREEDLNNTNLVTERVQDIDMSPFLELDSGDILFIDSSHVSKFQSDVNHILFNVLPLLKPGVIIHFHDIFWPFDYPKAWYNQKRAWNESFLLRAFLQCNSNYRIFLFNSLMETISWSPLYSTFGYLPRHSGSSLWLKKQM